MKSVERSYGRWIVQEGPGDWRLLHWAWPPRLGPILVSAPVTVRSAAQRNRGAKLLERP